MSLLLPLRCLGCRQRLPPEGARSRVCVPCRTRLRPPPHPRCRRCHFPLGTGRRPAESCLACATWPPVIERARAAVLLQPPADALVHALKYEGWRELGPVMATRMAALDPGADARARGVVVPVPTTRRRRRRRGYNQAALLARALASRLDRPLVDALRRRGGRGTQVALRPSERRANVREAFGPAVPDASRVAGMPVILVDDVLTTGATVSAAAVALERAGASGVCVIAFARSMPRLTPDG